MIEQPIERQLDKANNILIAGCGGGYDILGAVPLMAALERPGRSIHLAGLTFSSPDEARLAKCYPDLPNLVAVSRKNAREDAYCPEAWLARWRKERLERDEPIWLFRKTGVQPLLRAYERLAKELKLDAVILIDGGIDALLRGDETSLGTPAEDYVSLAAVNALAGVPVKVLACLGMGAERRDGVRHVQVFERMMELTALDAYWGACALLPGTKPGDLYLDALRFVFKHQETQKRSHVHACVRAAMGHGEEASPPVWLWPLLNMCWFFSLPDVAASHLLLKHLEKTNEILQATFVIRGVRKTLPLQDSETIPL
jgi:hypothetical protein